MTLSLKLDPEFGYRVTLSTSAAVTGFAAGSSVSIRLPDSLALVSVSPGIGASAAVTPPLGESSFLLAPNNVVVVTFAAGLPLGAAEAPAVTLRVYVRQFDSAGVPVANRVSGDAAPLSLSTVVAASVLSPLVLAGPASFSIADAVRIAAAALDRTAALSLDGNSPGVTPGDAVTLTTVVRTSDYFVMGDIVLSDSLSEAHVFDPTGAVTVTKGGAVISLLTSEYSAELQVNGDQRISFRVSDALARLGLDAGLLRGAQTLTLRYRARVAAALSSGPTSPGDTLDSTSTLITSVREVGAETRVLSSGSRASVGANTLAIAAGAEPVLALYGSGSPLTIGSGGLFTVSATFAVPPGSWRSLVFSLYLPTRLMPLAAPVFMAGPGSAAAPLPGRASLGPATTPGFQGAGGVQVDYNTQSVTVTMLPYAGAPLVTAVQILLTLQDAATLIVEPMPLPFLLLAGDNTDHPRDPPASRVAHLVISQSSLKLRAAVVSRSPNAYALGPATSPSYPAYTRFFSVPTAASACPRAPAPGAPGPLSSAALQTYGALPVALEGADAGDRVTVALVVENNGLSPAFDVHLRLTLPPGSSLAAVREATAGTPLRVCIASGAGGAPLSWAALTLGGDLSNGGMDVTDIPLLGSIAGSAQGTGANILVVTVDLLASDRAAAGEVTTLTAELLNYAGGEGLPNLVAGPTAAQITVGLARPTVSLAVLSSSEAQTVGTDVARGELVTLRATLTFPEGVTESNVYISLAGAPVTMVVTGSLISSIGANLRGCLLIVGDAGVVLTGRNGLPDVQTFTLGPIHNFVQDGVATADDTLTLDIVARVSITDTFNPASPSPVLNNTVTLNYTMGNSSGSLPLSIVDPVARITHTLTPGGRPVDATTPAFPIRGTVTVSHDPTLSRAAVYDAYVLVTFPSSSCALAVGSASADTAGGLNDVLQGNTVGDVAVRVRLPATWGPSQGPFTVTYGINLPASSAAGAPFSTQAQLVYNTLPSGRGRANTLSAPLASSIAVPFVTVSATAADTSNPDTGSVVGDPAVVDLVVGETATVRFNIFLPEGFTATAQTPLVCTVDAGADPAARLFQILSASTVSVGSRLTLSPVALPTAALANNVAQWQLGSAVNPADDLVAAATDAVVVQAQVRLVRGSSSALASLPIVCGAGTPFASAPAAFTADVVGPKLLVSVVLSAYSAPLPMQGGDQFDVTMTVSHTALSSSAAYELYLGPLAGSCLAAVPGSLTVTSASAYTTLASPVAPRTLFTLHLSRFDPSAGAIVVKYRGALTAAALAGTQCTVGGFGSFQSFPLTVDTTGLDVSGSALGSASVPLAVPTVTVSTVSVTQGGESGTGSSSLNRNLTDVSIGEQIKLQVLVRVPQGTTPLVVEVGPPDAAALAAAAAVPQGARLAEWDLVVSRVEFLGNSITSPTLVVGSSASPGSPSGTWTFNFGNIVNAPDSRNDAGDTILVQATIAIRDSLASDPGALLLLAARCLYGVGTVAGGATLEVVGPSLSIATSLNIATGDAGDIRTATLVIRHTAASTAAAHRIVITDPLDLLPGAFVFVPNSVSSSAGVVTSAADGSMVVTVDKVLLSDLPVTVVYQVRLSNAVAAGTSLSTNPRAVYNSVMSGAGRSSTAAATATLVVNSPTVSVGPVATTLGLGSLMWDPLVADVAVGETVTVDFAISAAEGTDSLSFRVSVAPAASLSILSLAVLSLGANVVLTGANANIAPAALPSSLSSTLGDGTLDSGVLPVGTIANAPDNKVSAADLITLRVTLGVVNAVDVADGTRATLAGWAVYGTGARTASATVPVEIVLPALSVALALTPSRPAIDAGDQIAARVTVTHAAGSHGPAFGVDVRDVFPPSFRIDNPQLVNVTVVTTSSSGAVTVATGAAALAATATISGGHVLVHLPALPAPLAPASVTVHVGFTATATLSLPAASALGLGATVDYATCSSADSGACRPFGGRARPQLSVTQAQPTVPPALAVPDATLPAVAVAVGVPVPLTVVLTFPEGRTEDASLQLSLPSGLALAGVTSAVPSGPLSSSYPGGFNGAIATPVVGQLGRDVKIPFGVVTNAAPDSNAVPETLTLTYALVCVDEPQVVPGSAWSHTWSWSALSSLPAAQGRALNATGFTPRVAASADVFLVDPGSRARFTVAVSLAPGSAGAYDGTVAFALGPMYDFGPTALLPLPAVLTPGATVTLTPSALLAVGYPTGLVLGLNVTVTLTSVAGDPGRLSPWTATATERTLTTVFAATAQVRINAPPIARDDSFVVLEDAPTVLDVLVNDVDPDGNLDPTTLRVAAPPARGTLVVVPKASASPGSPGPYLQYLGSQDYNGLDSFSYTVCDLNAPSCSTAFVTLTVTPVDDAVVAVRDQAVVLEDASVVIPVALNDTDPDGGLASAAGPDPTSVVIAVLPAHGQASVNPVTGDVTYTPYPDYHGADTFQYRIFDSNRYSSALGVVTVAVLSLNDPPAIRPVLPATGPEDTTFGIPVAVLDVDDGGAAVAATLRCPVGTLGLPAGIPGVSFTVLSPPGPATPGGAPTPQQVASLPIPWSWIEVSASSLARLNQALAGLTFRAPFDLSGGFSVALNVTDSPDPGAPGQAPLGAALTWTVNVTAVFDPLGAAPDTAAVDEGGAVDVDVLFNDYNPEGARLPETLEVVPGSVAPVGSTAAPVYSPSLQTTVVRFSPPPAFYGVASFAYRVWDTRNNSALATVTVTVRNLNSPSVLTGGGFLQAIEDSDTALPVRVSDPDPPTDRILVRVTPTIGRIVFGVVSNLVLVNGSLDASLLSPPATEPGVGATFSGEMRDVQRTLASAVWRPPLYFHNGPVTVAYAVQDGAFFTELRLVFNITAVNHAIVARPDAVTTPEDTAAVWNVVANDLDIDGDLIRSLSVVRAPLHGNVTVLAWPLLRYTPFPNYFGPDSFAYAVGDALGPVTANVTITVTPVNDPPVIGTAADLRNNIFHDRPGVLLLVIDDPDVLPDGVASGGNRYLAGASVGKGTLVNSSSVDGPLAAVQAWGSTLRFTYNYTGGSFAGDADTLFVWVYDNNWPGQAPLNVSASFPLTIRPYPRILSAVTRPATGDAVPGVGDIIVVSFVSPMQLPVVSQVDPATGLPAVSPNLSILPEGGLEYVTLHGLVNATWRYQWLDSRTLSVILTRVQDWTAPASNISLQGTKALVNSDSGRPVDPDVILVTGGWGAGPLIQALVADDPDNYDAVYGKGDVIAINFTMPVQTRLPLYTRALVDGVFGFSAPLGADYTGVWVSDSQAVLTIVDPEGHGDVAINRFTVTILTPLLTNDAGTATSSVGSVSPYLTGQWGTAAGVSPCVASVTIVPDPEGARVEVAFVADDPTAVLQPGIPLSPADVGTFLSVVPALPEGANATWTSRKVLTLTYPGGAAPVFVSAQALDPACGGLVPSGVANLVDTSGANLQSSADLKGKSSLLLFKECTYSAKAGVSLAGIIFVLSWALILFLRLRRPPATECVREIAYREAHDARESDDRLAKVAAQHAKVADKEAKAKAAEEAKAHKHLERPPSAKEAEAKAAAAAKEAEATRAALPPLPSTKVDQAPIRDPPTFAQWVASPLLTHVRVVSGIKTRGRYHDQRFHLSVLSCLALFLQLGALGMACVFLYICWWFAALGIMLIYLLCWALAYLYWRLRVGPAYREKLAADEAASKSGNVDPLALILPAVAHPGTGGPSEYPVTVISIKPQKANEPAPAPGADSAGAAAASELGASSSSWVKPRTVRVSSTLAERGVLTVPEQQEREREQEKRLRAVASLQATAHESGVQTGSDDVYPPRHRTEATNTTTTSILRASATTSTTSLVPQQQQQQQQQQRQQQTEPSVSPAKTPGELPPLKLRRPGAIDTQQAQQRFAQQLESEAWYGSQAVVMSTSHMAPQPSNPLRVSKAKEVALQTEKTDDAHLSDDATQTMEDNVYFDSGYSNNNTTNNNNNNNNYNYNNNYNSSSTLFYSSEQQKQVSQQQQRFAPLTERFGATPTVVSAGGALPPLRLRADVRDMAVLKSREPGSSRPTTPRATTPVNSRPVSPFLPHYAHPEVVLESEKQ